MDWCLLKIREAGAGKGLTEGIVYGPLNDNTEEGYWAFNQAYMYAGLERLGTAHARFGHPRAQECLDTAEAFRPVAERAFRAASVRSPLVQLRDHAWIPYVPNEVTKPGRIFDQWYATDVDTGAVHLLRLKAIPAESDLADRLLNDHEDNLYLHGWGVANEPVYNQQATACLLRDDVKAVIRAIYSTMASGFSHSVFEPVEHRWFWGQFFGPPSTDGAWFELYRNMLVREVDDETLLLAQATPRKWLEEGKRIEVRKAPTYFGKVSYRLESRANSGTITASLQLESRKAPKLLLLRIRHPEGKTMRAVTLNGNDWSNFDPEKERVRIPLPERAAYSILFNY